MKDHHFGLDVLENADGSARLVVGNTEIVVAVHGPAPVKAKQELTDRAALEVIIQPLSSPPCTRICNMNFRSIYLLGVKDTAMANKLKKLLDQIILSQLHPRTLITVVVQPIRLDGSVFACMVNACVAALIDASIPLRTSFIAVSAVQAEALEIFPSQTQEEASNRPIFAVFDANKPEEPVAFELNNGDLSPEAKQALSNAAQDIYKSLRGTVKQRLDVLKFE